jgi:hypothetical protein
MPSPFESLPAIGNNPWPKYELAMAQDMLNPDNWALHVSIINDKPVMLESQKYKGHFEINATIPMDLLLRFLLQSPIGQRLRK